MRTQRAVKLCMVMKLDVRQIVTGSSRPRTKCFDDTNADALSVCGSQPSCPILDNYAIFFISYALPHHVDQALLVILNNKVPKIAD